MTSVEEVPRIPSSICARQAEPPAPPNGRVHVFSRGGTIPQRSLMVVFLARNEQKRLPQCPNDPLNHSHCDSLGRVDMWISPWISLDMWMGLVWISGTDSLTAAARFRCGPGGGGGVIYQH